MIVRKKKSELVSPSASAVFSLAKGMTIKSHQRVSKSSSAKGMNARRLLKLKKRKSPQKKKGKSHTRRVVFRLICITLQKRVMKRRQTKRRKRRLSRSQLKEKERKKDSKTKRKVILNRFCATSTTILVETTLKGGWAS